MRDRDLRGFGPVGTNGPQPKMKVSEPKMPEPSPYADRDLLAMASTYAFHVHAMTKFGLFGKSAIAAELAYRDQRIAELESAELRATAGIRAEVDELVKAVRWLQRLRAIGNSSRESEASEAVDAALATPENPNE